MKASAVKAWIEAMRLRTLPVSVAGVLMGWALSLSVGSVRWLPGIICLIFAILAQIASNFANEYYDFRDGLDRPGREGPRRGVTEGDITPAAMKRAVFAVLGLACLLGLSLVAWGGWWVIAAGIVIAIGAMAYSAGPWPLSRHGLGEVAVIAFFGIIPVCLTYYLMADALWTPTVVLASVAVGLMGSNVLIVNNYRDADDDRAVGKRTLAVILGRRPMLWLYAANGLIAAALMLPLWLHMGLSGEIIAIAYVALHLTLTARLTRLRGAALNPLLGITATLMLATALATLATTLR